MRECRGSYPVPRVSGTWQHFALGFFSVLLDLLIWEQVHTAIIVMNTVELVQWDAIGLQVGDTLHDLTLDAIGGILGWLVTIGLHLRMPT